MMGWQWRQHQRMIVDIYMYIYIYTSYYIYIYIYVYICMYICVYVYIHIYDSSGSISKIKQRRETSTRTGAHTGKRMSVCEYVKKRHQMKGSKHYLLLIFSNTFD
jgi:hypothetical protein